MPELKGQAYIDSLSYTDKERDKIFSLTNFLDSFLPRGFEWGNPPIKWI